MYANRSREFAEGVQAVLENLGYMGTLDCQLRPCPYPQGTAACDAWFAGVREGKRLWHIQNAKNELKAKAA